MPVFRERLGVALLVIRQIVGCQRVLPVLLLAHHLRHALMRQRVVAVDFQRLLPVVQRLGIAAFAVQRHRLMDELDEVRRFEHGDRPRVVVQHIQEALAVMVDGHGNLEQPANRADAAEGAQQVAFLVVLVNQPRDAVNHGDDAVVLHRDVRHRRVEQLSFLVLQGEAVFLRLVGVVADGVQLANLRGFLVGQDAVNHVVRADVEVGVARRLLLHRALNLRF